MSILTERAIQVGITVRQWHPRRMDKTVTQEVAEQYGMAGSPGRYTKDLFWPNKPLRPVQTAISALRDYYYSHTLPWSDAGFRVLPNSQILEVCDNLETLAAKVRQEVELVYRHWDLHVDKAAQVHPHGLGRMFRKTDYPSATKFRERFSVEIKREPIAEFSDDLRLQIGDEEYGRVTAECTARLQDNLQAAVSDLYKRLSDVVGAVQSRLGDPDAIFRDSLIGNVREVCEIVPRLNLTGNHELESLAREINDKLTAYDPATLRSVPMIRQAAANQASDIMDRMRHLMPPTTT